MFFRPGAHDLPHNPFKAIVAPRPIAWVSSMGADGIANLAPYSFFNAFSDAPPMVAYGSGNAKIGIDEGNPVLDDAEGEPFFDDRGRPAAWLTDRTRLLESSVQQDLQTDAFISRMRELSLTRGININVHHEDGQVQTITGLHTIDEDQLAKLPDDAVLELHNNGYMTIVHAMLLSVFQLNSLMRLRNVRGGGPRLSHVRLEIARDRGAHDG